MALLGDLETCKPLAKEYPSLTTAPTFRQPPWRVGLRILALILLGACAPAIDGIPALPVTDSDRVVACTLVPQQTGEKIIPLKIGTPPPPQADPGAIVTFSYVGGYRISNIAKLCGSGEPVTYIFANELSDISYKRPVHVWLDETPVAAMTCDFHCKIEFLVPIDLPAGKYRLNLGPPYGPRELEFELFVGNPARG